MSKAQQTAHIDPLKQGRLSIKIIGVTPLYFNAYSAKAKRDLLIGGGRKTAAEKKAIKHDPEAEFRNSCYRAESGPTLLCFPAPGFKQAMATAALETPGVTKTSVKRLIFLPEMKVKIWGTPYLKMDVVRSADMNRTPDVRTRAFLPRWCSEIDVAYAKNTLSAYDVVSLLANAGIICGIGDFRQEKGAGSFGTFQVCDEENEAEWQEIAETMGRKVQQKAFDNPECADMETQELFEMLVEERQRREAA